MKTGASITLASGHSVLPPFSYPEPRGSKPVRLSATGPCARVPSQDPTKRTLGMDAKAPETHLVVQPSTSESSSLYRKHRPAAFSELAGQPAVVAGLSEAVKSDRVVHAYLFAGPRGTGKTSAARIFAKCLNCLRDGPRPDPCGECEACVAIANGTAFDVIEIDAASNRGINEIRELRERVKFAPAQFRTKVYIIDEVHMLTPEAFNALLKTLEEPPDHVVFILATTELHRVPATILSRCQRYEFRRLSPAVIAQQLKTVATREKIRIDEAAIERMAFLADGAMRDALVLLEQARGFSGDGAIDQAVLDRAFGESHRELIEAAADAVIAADPAAALAAVAKAVERGADPAWMTKELLRWFRLALLAQVSAEVLETEVPRDEAGRIGERAAKLPRTTVFRALRSFSDVGRFSTQPRIDLELALMRVIRPTDELDLKRLSERLAELEERLRDGTGATRTTTPGAPTPRKASSAGELTRTKLEAQWPLVLGDVKERSLTCYGWLAHAAIDEASDELVVLRLGKKFYADSLAEPTCMSVLRAAIERVSGKSPKVQFVVDPAASASLRAAPASDSGFALAESVLGDLM